MIRQIDKDTQVCISVASRPGTFGNRFHNFLYEAMGLNFIYKSFGVSNLEDAIRGMRALGFRGCGVTMPFKEEVLKLLDRVDPVAAAIGAVNTIVNDRGVLTGYNTDYIAVKELLAQKKIPTSSRTAIFGSGGMAKAIVTALSDSGFKQGVIFSRNIQTGPELAERANFRWNKEFNGETFDFLINASPIGMAPEPNTMPFSQASVSTATFVLDSVGNPSETLLIQTARVACRTVITGSDITLIQGREQFRHYTGLVPSDELLKQVSAHLAR